LDHSYTNSSCPQKQETTIKKESGTASFAVESKLSSRKKKKVSTIKNDSSVTPVDKEDHAKLGYAGTEKDKVNDVTSLAISAACETVKDESLPHSDYLETKCFEVSEEQEIWEQSEATVDGVNEGSSLYTVTDTVLDTSVHLLVGPTGLGSHSKSTQRTRVKGKIVKSEKTVGGLDNKGNIKRFKKRNISGEGRTLASHRTLKESASHICHVCGKIFPTRGACRNHCRSHVSEKLVRALIKKLYFLLVLHYFVIWGSENF